MKNKQNTTKDRFSKFYLIADFEFICAYMSDRQGISKTTSISKSF